MSHPLSKEKILKEVILSQILFEKRQILLLLAALDVCVGTLLRYSKLQSHLSTTKSFVFLCLSSSEHVSFNNILILKF